MATVMESTINKITGTISDSDVLTAKIYDITSFDIWTVNKHTS